MIRCARDLLGETSERENRKGAVGRLGELKKHNSDLTSVKRVGWKKGAREEGSEGW